MGAIWLRVLLVCAALAAPGAAAEPLRARLDGALIQQIFPGAEEVGADEGEPPALPVRIGGELAGYIFSTKDTVNATGYAGTPFDIVGGLTLDGRITGAALLDEHESILDRGVGKGAMTHFVAGFAAASLRDWSAVRPDQVKGATTSARLMKSGMQSAARTVAQNRLEAPPVLSPTIDRNRYVPQSAAKLLAGGAVVHVRATVAEIAAAFAAVGGRPDHAAGDAGAAFVDVYLGLVTPPSVGISVLGQQRYNEGMDRQQDGLTVWIAIDGEYPYAGTAHQLLPTGYFFDTVKLVQDGREIAITPNKVRGLRAADASQLDDRDSALVFLAADAGLDPLQAWQTVIAISGKTAAGGALTLPFAIPYRLPETYILRPPPPPAPEPPPWVEAWRDRAVDVGILGALLIAVTSVFLFQDVLTRYPRVYVVARICLLGFTLGWLGWVAGGQLSIVNVMAYLQAPFTGTPLSTFLIDPILFVLTAYVAVSLVLLGRGVYCGWLCPFGALQELTNRVARALHVPQITVPHVVQERLWAVKYLAAVALLGLVFFAVRAADSGAEIEPFKTVISARFGRELPYVLYAGALLLAGLFIERFYCRFLCPLGGALAVLGRARLFLWLKRRPQCGSECRVCEVECPIGAIQPSGAINMNECLQCMDCQVAYHDDHKCLPLIQRRKRRAQRQVPEAAAVAG